MKRRSFIVGLAGSGVVGLLPPPAKAAASTQDPVATARTARLRLTAVQTKVRLRLTAIRTKVLEENAIAREMLAKALGPRFAQLPPERYQSLQRSLEPAIRSALPTTQEFSRFNSRAIAQLPADAPLRRELRELTSDAFLERVLRVAGFRNAPAPTAPPSTCLVLSGGGAKGSFEVGFLAYLKRLWSVLNITAVCGTSVGAVNAVPIAQSGAAGIDRLVDLWLALRTDSDMFVLHPSLLPAKGLLGGLGIDIENLLDLFSAEGLQTLTDTLGVNLDDEVVAGTAGIGGMVTGTAVGGPLGFLIGLGGLVASAVSASNAADTLQQLRAKFTQLGSALTILFSAPGLKSFSPLEGLIQRNVDAARLGQPANPRLRLAMVCLEDGDPYYFCETGALLRGSADPSKAVDSFWKGGMTPSKVRQAVIASSSVPVLFPAVPITEDHGPAGGRRRRHFVDGGVREVLPVRAAVDLGCQRVIGVLASGLQMDTVKYAASPPAAFGLASRVLDTVLNEVTRNDAEFASDPGVHVLGHPMPGTEVIDAFQIDPGLIRINVDYGYMRAYDATLDLAGKKLGLWQKLTLLMAELEIVRLRKEIWGLENGVVMTTFFIQGVLNLIRAKKRELLEWTLIRFQASDKDRDSLPIEIYGASGPATRIHDWWGTWERHQPGAVATALAANGLWTRLRIDVSGSREGSVPAAPSTSEF